MDLIEINNLNFSYPTKKDTLKNINLKINKGTFNCIVGENGSRKDNINKMHIRIKQRLYRRNQKRRTYRIFASKK